MAFNIGFYAYAIIGHTRADQLLPQLLMEQFDTFPKHCRHIEHMHEGVLFRKNSRGTKVEKMLTLAPERYTAGFCTVAKIILWCT